eukprot:TRINITY_DN3688_c0_g1_i1.p1 TRINITY_DN3688_c0_g1~~TRINITY_DN3688_c0_g1_i1.p1  ORF type:complete len:123 (+),score=29.98 TRINITY_DN3688_c0_g1_i1:48-416(+)
MGIRAKELRTYSPDDLLNKLDELKQELSQLRNGQVTGSTPTKLAKIKEIRRSIARVLTVYNQNSKAYLRKDLRGDKYLPIDLRKKQTRAIRRRLTVKQAAALTLKDRKKLAHFPQRVYAVKN